MPRTIPPDRRPTPEGWRRHARRIAILVGGVTLLLLGVLIAPLPGPGPLLLIPAGLAVLATEYEAARRANRWLLRKVRRNYSRLKGAHTVDPPSKGEPHQTDPLTPPVQ